MPTPRIGDGTRRQNAMARRIRRECKRTGLSLADAVDYAMRRGLRRQDAVKVVAMAYRAA